MSNSRTLAEDRSGVALQQRLEGVVHSSTVPWLCLLLWSSWQLAGMWFSQLSRC